MIIGNGLIATTLEKYKNRNDIVIFASGVSNSSETKQNAFNREKSLLLKFKNHGSKIIYFGTCSVYDTSIQDTSYIKHKLDIEKTICENFRNYLIVRLPSLIGVTNNPNTLFNFFLNSIFKGHILNVYQNAWRYLMDAEDLKFIIPLLLDTFLHENKIINVAYSNAIPVINMIRMIEQELEIKAKTRIVTKGTQFKFNNSEFLNLLKKKDIAISENYNLNLVRKYVHYFKLQISNP